MNIYKELYEYLKSADIEAQNRAFNTPDYVFDLTYEEFCKQVEPREHVSPVNSASYGFKGKKHLDQTKQKIRESNLGQKRSIETRKNIQRSLIASPHARSKNQLGDKNPMFGKKHSEVAKAKMSKSRSGRPSGALGKNWKRNEESKKKMSETCKGRKKYTRPDGSWTWIYPSKILD